MKTRKLILFCTILIWTSGCANMDMYNWGKGTMFEPLIASSSFSNNYLLSCLSDMETLGINEFDAKFKTAEVGLQDNRNLDKLRFICLSLNEKADYKQFKKGKKVLEDYIEDHPELGEDMHGFQILVDRLDEEILNRWSAWKSLLNDKKELTAEVESLKIKLEAQQKQIEKLKNIEPIIKSREADQ